MKNVARARHGQASDHPARGIQPSTRPASVTPADPRVQIAAARARVAIDELRGLETPDWIVALSLETPEAPAQATHTVDFSDEELGSIRAAAQLEGVTLEDFVHDAAVDASSRKHATVDEGTEINERE